MKQIHLIHGFGEARGGNISGFADLQDRIEADNPGAFVSDYTQDEFDDVLLSPTHGKIILVGRSWGGAAAFRYIDKHPDVKFDLLVAFDPVTNFFRSPRSWPCIGWTRRKNLKLFLSLNESESLLKGHRVADKSTPFIPGEKGIIWRETDWYKEVVLPNDPSTHGFGDFASHFTISKNEYCINLALEAIKSV